MKKAAFVRHRAEKKAQEMTSAAAVYRVALADLLKANPEEEFHDALVRQIDARIAFNRWYRRLWRLVVR